ncbi:MAG: RecQ family ATP-dependent DNA helicase [Muribaculaceae bacterium]
MSIWRKIIDSIYAPDNEKRDKISRDASRYAVVDVEVGFNGHRIHDIGALRHDGAVFHSPRRNDLVTFLEGVDYICGHNIVHHDATYLFGNQKHKWALVDTLYMSPLLFPERPYHRLLKDDKLVCDEVNNPVNDCEKAGVLMFEEIEKWKSLPDELQQIYATLLQGIKEFEGFLEMVDAKAYQGDIAELILSAYDTKICSNADIISLVESKPAELAYALALITTTDYRSITPAWVLHNYPSVEYVVKQLRHTQCATGCKYCNATLDVHVNLKAFFGYDEFRTYEGEPLQETAARAAVAGRSLLAIFPTGGGKSLTFQLPALMAGRTVHGLTVVISPLQSLMKDQVDNLAERGIADAVTINGLLDPISRSLAIQRVQDGDASLLYIAPEMLRSSTIEKILLGRTIERFVIDEAHCFSSWGQDFRVDYLYIGKFIKQYQIKKHCNRPIPVSCFTATAKQKVVQDICDYFKTTLDIDLALFASSASRTNLRYSVIHAESDEDKYGKLRSLIAESSCPTIVYVSRTKRTSALAERLTCDGYEALPYNGKMNSDEKIANQEAFMSDKVRIIVATSAFGMGVDKRDVGLVVHYDISDSLENYVQEAGRAGRDPKLQARCFVLYSDGDLDKHFVLLNQTKLSISEIQQVWKVIKDLTKQRERTCQSALEIARLAGWDENVTDVEMRVRTALSALEQSGYIERGNNVPHVYATGITVKNMEEARKRITESSLFDSTDVENAVRVIKSLISSKNIAKSSDSEAESRIDYLADILGIKKSDVVSVVERMRQEGILADSKDISAYLQDIGDSERKSAQMLERFAQLEHYILAHIPDESLRISYKQLNEDAQANGVKTSKEKDIRTLLYFLTVKGYTRRHEDGAQNMHLTRQADMESTLNRFERRQKICRFVVEWLYSKVVSENNVGNKAIAFSVVELLNDYKNSQQTLFDSCQDTQIADIEEALLYLSKIGALKLEGGFLVLYNAMDIRRVQDTKVRYKQEDYRLLNEFYKQKIQQVHIVGEFANIMVRDYNAALQYVQDYFNMDYKYFIAKYFKGARLQEIGRNLTPKRYDKIFGALSSKQMEIISDKDSHCIVVAAGPGSGKTRVLVHKLASLLLLEDVKHEQMLMITFSRTAATEFKQRLMSLIGNAAHFVEIKTFHSYCFDLLGKIGNLYDAKDVVERAARMINDNEVEPNKIRKTVLVIDEAQDMGEAEYSLVEALMKANEDMRVIAVGDDDQNIFSFRGSDSKYMGLLRDRQGSRFVEMTENYRSSKQVVDFANSFVKGIPNRFKSTPISSKNGNEGRVNIYYNPSQYLYSPLATNLMHYRSGSGTTCVLTQTNEEAVTMVAYLRRCGVNCLLVQTMGDLKFWNLIEVRTFLRYLDKTLVTPIIPTDIWAKAKSIVFSKFARSAALQYLEQCVKSFEQINPQKKYISDFKEFVFESSLEDFCDYSGSDVVVSTIHKAKGREFDDVYMLIANTSRLTTELQRCWYVGMTRAKRRLFIHTNTPYFEGMPHDDYRMTQEQYAMPREVVLQLSHSDVVLSFFANCQKRIAELYAGAKLTYSQHYFFEVANNNKVAKLSAKMQGDLQQWLEKGYVVTDANVRFIVAWRAKDAEKGTPSYAIILPNITLSRSETKNEVNNNEEL